MKTEEEIKSYRQEWKRRNRERNNANQRKCYAKNREKILEKQREYQKKNRAKLSASFAKWKAKNPEKSKEAGRRYWNKNKEKLKEKNKQYRKNNPASVLGSRLKARIAAWIMSAMIKRTAGMVKNSAEYLVWQAKRRGIDIQKCHVHHLRACACYDPFSEEDFKMAHQASNLWLISPEENYRINDGDSPAIMLSEASLIFKEYVLIGSPQSGYKRKKRGIDKGLDYVPRKPTFEEMGLK